ncbi:MAG: hypothetical protein D6762_09265 [Candidatus Neomarinimicrobiota bacterium]|nr:MAG: hypothetical protein D6762_09265 [Candidatus Neomarinimicrobiota bacterium]
MNAGAPWLRFWLVVLLLWGAPEIRGQIRQTGEPAGRTWKIGDDLPDSLWEQVAPEPGQLTGRDYVFLVFTRQNHSYSRRYLEDLDALITAGIRDRIVIREIITPPFGEELQPEPGSRFPQLDDSRHRLYDQMGVRVFPTLFILDPTGKILQYVPGYTPTLKSRLRTVLALYFPREYQLPEAVNYTHRQKQRLRREDLARKLYDQGRYGLARQELDRVDSLSLDGRVLLGMIFLRTHEWPAADSLFLTLPDDHPYVDYKYLGRGVAAFQQQQLDSARTLLRRVQTLPEMERVHYWRGEVARSLKLEREAMEEFRRSARQAHRQNHTLIP